MPTVVRFVVMMATVAEPFRVPGATGVAESQEPPVVVAAVAVKASPVVPVIVSVCGFGFVPPI